MNTQILKSKKFRAALLAAITSLLTFAVSKGWFKLDVSETITLISTMITPFLIYIGAEGYSEAGAKEAIATNKIKEENASKDVVQDISKDTKNETV